MLFGTGTDGAGGKNWGKRGFGGFIVIIQFQCSNKLPYFVSEICMKIVFIKYEFMTCHIILYDYMAYFSGFVLCAIFHLERKGLAGTKSST